MCVCVSEGERYLHMHVSARTYMRVYWERKSWMEETKMQGWREGTRILKNRLVDARNQEWRSRWPKNKEGKAFKYSTDVPKTSGVRKMRSEEHEKKVCSPRSIHTQFISLPIYVHIFFFSFLVCSRSVHRYLLKYGPICLSLSLYFSAVLSSIHTLSLYMYMSIFFLSASGLVIDVYWHLFVSVGL